MILFKNIKIRNFKSFSSREVSLRLDEHPSILILGDNQDVGQSGTSRNGSGKCLGVDTPILMHDGTIKMVQDVALGDKVMGPNGTPRSVLSLARGQEEMFNVHQNIGMDYVVNRSHILSLKVGTTRPKYGHVKGKIINISIDTYLSYPDHVKKGVCGYVADLTDLSETPPLFDPWFLGLWLADGTTKKPQISINEKDVELIDEVGSITTKLYGYTENFHRRNGCVMLSYAGGLLVKLRKIGVLGDKHIPVEFLRASYSDRLELLAGILDGDGHKAPDKHAFDIILKDNQLAEDFVFLARSVGLRVAVRDKFCKCDGFAGAFYKRFTLTGEIEKIPNRLSRKKSPNKSITSKPRHFGVTGISLTSLGVGDYYGFEVSGDGLFCLGDFTVTHNSSALEAIFYAAYGRLFGRQKSDELINITNGKNMYVELDLEIDGKPAKITRGRKPNILEFVLDGVNLTRDSMKNTDEEIVSAIGMDYDVFLSIVFLSPFKESFMSLTPADQRTFIEVILSLDTLVERAESIKAIRKDLAVDIKLANKDLDNAVMSREKAEKQRSVLFDKATLFEEDRDKRLRENKKLITELSEVDFKQARQLAKEIGGLVQYRDDVQKKIPDQSGMMADYKRAQDQRAYVDSLTEKGKKWHEDNTAKITKLENEVSLLPDKEDIALKDDIDIQTMKLNQDLAKKTTGVSNLRAELDRIDKNQEKMEKEHESLDEGVCPYCKQRHTDEKRLDELLGEFSTLETQRDRLLDTIKKYDNEIKDIEKETQEATERRPDIAEGVSMSEVERLTAALVDARKATSPYDEQIEELNPEWIDAELDGLRIQVNKAAAEKAKHMKDIDDATASIDKKTKECNELVGTIDPTEIKYMEKEEEILQQQFDAIVDETNLYTAQFDEIEIPTEDVYYTKLIDDLTEKERHAGYLVKLLTDPKSFIRKNIVDQYLPFLNKRITEYTDRLGLMHVAEVNSDMTVDIEYLGKTVGYYSLSRGERLRLDVAAAMAFRELLKLLGISTNLLMVDELFDSAIDSYGSTCIFHFIGDFADNVILISHREEFDSLVSQKLNVVKKNGFSDLSFSDPTL
jgi:DNA repair exonuclease SbcCD ATPase subunit